MATTRNDPPARCLDLTRLVSRVGRGAFTGIDRVEMAYLERLLEEPAPLYALVTTGRGHYLLGPAGVGALHRRLKGEAPWGANDAVSALLRRHPPLRRRAEADLRRLAVGRARRGGLAQLLGRHLPAGIAWLNVGHSNLGEEVFSAVAAHPGATMAVFIHDTIPLDHPEFQREETVASFARKLQLAGRHADLIIANSGFTRGRIEAHLAATGRVPEVAVAHLGVSPATPRPQDLPPGLDRSRPHFVALGTLEPRKNLMFLLDIWERLAAAGDGPLLYLVGRRGWKSEALFRRLEAGPANVHELGSLPDGAVSALVQGSAGLLMPSLAEGFGLPVAEAAVLGAPVICNTLPVYQEFAGDYPVYVNVSDMYLWETKIRKLADRFRTKDSERRTRAASMHLPTWQEHFDHVLQLT